MRISCTYRGKEKEWESSRSEVIIGRVEDRSGRSLDLTPDSGVSRLHARIWEANGCYWIEDLNSTGGTKLNGVEIKSQGQKEVQTGNVILAGRIVESEHMTVHTKHGGQMEAYRVYSCRPVVSDQREKMEEAQQTQE